ncbi:MAG: DUF4292 domain-containing protein [Candidatus Kapabacteria bacterium]|nr:DUF4292 domain-containing protein [Candidatus Kapabacteria bacterium]
MTTYNFSSEPITRGTNAIVPSQLLKSIFLFLNVSFIMLGGCATTKTEQQKEVTKTADTQTDKKEIATIDYKGIIPSRNSSLRAYSAECSVNTTLNDTPLQGECSIDILRTDSLKMIINGPFGILVGKLSATNERLLYFDAMQMQVLEGNTESKELQERLPIPLAYNDFIHLLRCEVPFEPQAYSVHKIDTAKNVMLIAYSSDPRYVDFAQVSMKDSTLLTYQRKSRKDEVLFNVNYADHSMKNAVRFPNKISLQFPPRKMSASFTVTKLDINPANGQYLFNVPKNVTRQQYK